MVLGAVLWGSLRWSCSAALCGPQPSDDPPVQEAWDSHPGQVRAVMRAFGSLHGRAPVFRSDEGERLRPSMSNRALRRRLKDTNGVVHVQYGQCASHSSTCPWVSISVDLHATRLEDAGIDVEEAVRTVELPDYRVFAMTDDTSLERSWLVWIQPDHERPVAAEVWITGTLGLERAALGALPIRGIEAALAAARGPTRRAGP